MENKVESQGRKTESKSWLNRRSKMEKILLLILVCLLVLLIVFVVLLAVFAGRKSPEAAGICLTAECVNAASRISQGIDPEVDPCENFFNYACGGWMKSHVVPSDRSNLASYSVLRDKIQITLKELLEAKSESNERPAIRKAKDLYRSCVNETQIENDDISVAYPLLREVGGWPILGDKPGGGWKERDFSLTNLLVSIMKYYNIPYVYPYVYKDSKNASRQIIYLDNPQFILPERKYYLEDRNSDVLMAYEKLGRDIAMEFGANENVAREDMKNILNLEIELANISTPNEQRRDNEKLYNKFSLKDMKKEFPESAKLDFSWTGYIRGLFSIKGVGIKITEDEEIVIKDMLYYQQLMPVLEKYDKRVIANYAVWRLMKNRARNLPRRFLDHLGAYGKVLYGAPRIRAKWRHCTSYIVDYMGLAIGKLFVESYFDKEAKEGMHEMIDKIEGAFKVILSSLSWMDKDTRDVAKEKVDYISRKIGYEDDLFDEDRLDQRYENVTVDPYRYFDNVLHLLHRSTVDEMLGLRYRLYRMNWETAPSTVNAYYNPQQNRIMFPAGILQPPYYHKNFPRSLNYGGIGTLIGHEITHGFDDKGRQMDKIGELHQWWNDEAVDKFNTLTQCFIKQYGNFSYPEAGGMKVNGIITLGENIADNGGIKQSYRAYRKLVSERGQEEDQLPGLPLTNNQLFFINFAQIRCAVMHKKDAINHLLRGPHSPSRFRIIGTLQNFPEFSQVFNCPSGSYMNPKKKCSVW